MNNKRKLIDLTLEEDALYELMFDRPMKKSKRLAPFVDQSLSADCWYLVFRWLNRPCQHWEKDMLVSYTCKLAREGFRKYVTRYCTGLRKPPDPSFISIFLKGVGLTLRSAALFLKEENHATSWDYPADVWQCFFVALKQTHWFEDQLVSYTCKAAREGFLAYRQDYKSEFEQKHHPLTLCNRLFTVGCSDELYIQNMWI
jgi:hypothetical protein